MDAIEFVKQLRRMNEKGVSKNCFIYPFAGQEPDSPEDVVSEVEEWAKKNSVKTRQSVFLEHYPNVRLVDGVVDIAPCQMEPKSYSIGAAGCKYAPCVICRSEYWMQEVE